MKITEAVKQFLTHSKSVNDEIKKDSASIDPSLVMNDLSAKDNNYQAGAFFDSDYNRYSDFGQNATFIDKVKQQAEKIETYRDIAALTDVNNAVEEIVNEVVINYGDDDTFKLQINEENAKLKTALQNEFDEICRMTEVKTNIYGIVKSVFIDGQGVFLCTYDEKNTKNGIKKIKQIDPKYFFYDSKKELYQYLDVPESELTIYRSGTYEMLGKMKYSPEEIVRVDFDLHRDGLNLSYLENAIKTAHMLQTLEDLLIPLRFSRSVSRRIFNVDVGDIPGKRVEEVMKQIQGKFKYKKFYNAKTGEVSNQQHITSMVEDYWFPNRSGGKGTTVDVLDETGNLGELNDILYFAKKLYRSLQVPTSRLDINPDGDTSWSYNTEQISIEDLRFYMFTTRIRHVYTAIYKEILKRQVLAKGIMTEKEWNDRDQDIVISFTNENTFIEKMKLNNFNQNIEILHNAQEDMGKIFSVSQVLKTIFKYTDDEIKDSLKEIQKEQKNKLFKNFYESDDFGEGDFDGGYSDERDDGPRPPKSAQDGSDDEKSDSSDSSSDSTEQTVKIKIDTSGNE